MSATLLEFAISLVILVVAWQIGIALAPDIFRLIRYLRHEVDQVAEQAEDDSDDPSDDPPKE